MLFFQYIHDKQKTEARKPSTCLAHTKCNGRRQISMQFFVCQPSIYIFIINEWWSWTKLVSTLISLQLRVLQKKKTIHVLLRIRTYTLQSIAYAIEWISWNFFERPFLKYPVQFEQNMVIFISMKNRTIETQATKSINFEGSLWSRKPMPPLFFGKNPLFLNTFGNFNSFK